MLRYIWICDVQNKRFTIDIRTLVLYNEMLAVPDFIMPLTRQQEQFSIAYIHSIASVAGYGVEEIRVDVDSVDLTITQYGDAETYPLIEGLKVQLKCTYAHIPDTGKGHLSFPISIKNYNDLRRKSLNPRVLVVLHVPRNIDLWLGHSEDSIVLNHCAYWTSLREWPDTDNAENITIDLPLSQRFTVSELKGLMEILAGGGRP